MGNSNQIHFPCDENISIEIGFKCPLKLLENPQFVDGKRFCEQCNKNVYDLRNLSNQEIYALASGKETICGRIQVDRISNQNVNNNKYFRKFISGFALFAFIVNVFSQKKMKDTLRSKEIDGLIVVAAKYDDGDNSYYSPKSKLLGGFKIGEKYIEKAKIIKLNNSSMNFGNINYNGSVDFVVEEYLVKKENIFLIETAEPNVYNYAIIRKDKFDDYEYQSINEKNIVKSELPKNKLEQSIYVIDGEEVDYEDFEETVNANPKDFDYFLLNSELASIFLEEKTKKNLYVAYSK